MPSKETSMSESDMSEKPTAARAAFGDSAFDAEWSTGRTWGLDEAVDHALATAMIFPVTA